MRFLPTKMSSQTPYKIRLIISGGGSWQQNNEGWEFCTQLQVQRVLVPTNITHSRMVSYIESKCGMEPFIGVTRFAYNDSGKVYILWTDEDVTQFLQFAGQLSLRQHFMHMMIFRMFLRHNNRKEKNNEKKKGPKVSIHIVWVPKLSFHKVYRTKVSIRKV